MIRKVGTGDTERIVILVCGTESFYPDDLVGVCFECGVTVYVRPYVRHITFRFCGACAGPLMYRHGVPDNVEMPPETLRELLEENRREIN